MTFVYRLDVTLPEGADAPGWCPDGWMPQVWDDADGRYVQEFRWPRKRHCLSLSTANRWAQQLRSWGATVTIRRSEPVVWPATNHEQGVVT